MDWDNLKFIAATLLFLRIVAFFFIVPVVLRQYKLFNQPIEPQTGYVRRGLFRVGLYILAGQIVPIIIDTNTLLSDATGNPPLLLVLYAYSNAVVCALSAFELWRIYRFIKKRNALEGIK